jgi:hypothetical protein
MPMVRACKRLTEPREKRSGHGSILELCRHPTIPDTDVLATSPAMSIKFRLPDGSDTDIVAHSYVAFRRRLPPADPEPLSRCLPGLPSGRQNISGVATSSGEAVREGRGLFLGTMGLALRFVDPCNDFLSEGGKVWPSVKEVAAEFGVICATLTGRSKAEIHGPTFAHEFSGLVEAGIFEGPGDCISEGSAVNSARAQRAASSTTCTMSPRRSVSKWLAICPRTVHMMWSRHGKRLPPYSARDV